VLISPLSLESSSLERLPPNSRRVSDKDLTRDTSDVFANIGKVIYSAVSTGVFHSKCSRSLSGEHRGHETGVIVPQESRTIFFYCVQTGNLTCKL
jgi:hypothetical protein